SRASRSSSERKATSGSLQRHLAGGAAAEPRCARATARVAERAAAVEEVLCARAVAAIEVRAAERRARDGLAALAGAREQLLGLREVDTQLIDAVKGARMVFAERAATLEHRRRARQITPSRSA